MERYICIHGHFYQPPRENAWLEAIEVQDSAYPYHDWNERVTAQSYAPNGASRILDSDGCIKGIVNNYARISFNFGPTLLLWLEEKAPDAYQQILDADRESRDRYSGHGSAIAQAYNHLIMPLANRRDKYTQVIWGIRDFEHRFGRYPEGMWLPETAVDLETLDIMAELGIKFTILAPHQAARMRKIGDEEWQDVTGGRIDPTMPYEQLLSSGRKISLFFYDGAISRAVAFEDVLNNGDSFANRLAGAFSDTRTWPQLVHIATDGETYGHHRPHGDMALAYAIDHIESNELARLTNYGEFLQKYPPTHQAEIIENTSWSCSHGVERWRSNCGDNSGAHPGWNQEWRAPLREAMNSLRDTLAPLYEEKAREFVKEPWPARDDYIYVILNRAPDNIDQYVAKHAVRELNDDDKVDLLKLMEIQRHAMLIFTSCGWFFDEISGIETVQVLQYAGRAIQLAWDLFGDQIEAAFLGKLAEAKSNIPENRDGAHTYEKFVRPAVTGLAKVAAHYAIDSLFEELSERSRVYSYTVERGDYRRLQSGQTRAAVGKARVISEITHEWALLNFGVLHLGEHNLFGGVRGFQGEDSYQAFVREFTDVFGRADFAEDIRRLDREFGTLTYSLRSLFLDEQRRIVDLILKPTSAEAQAVYRQIYERHAQFMHFLAAIYAPLPQVLRAAAEATLNDDLYRALGAEPLDTEHIRSVLEEARALHIELNRVGAGYILRQRIERLAERFRQENTDMSILDRLEAKARLARSQDFGFEIDLWEAQNIYYQILQTVYPDVRNRADQGDQNARKWADTFVLLGERLGIRT